MLLLHIIVRNHLQTYMDKKNKLRKGEKHHLQGGIISLFWDLVVYSLWALDHSTNSRSFVEVVKIKH